ncbi:unnamed protein product [Paramecium primaurelia]|uniref:Cyclic nucleotide-binding domain-containing protein n=1 Tax=Paramecium primaurelia TaxID=5886 RepID=A0A8S1PYZ8_PARPR|nr:unnamed protein product [Paramecium primaurelia]
MKPSKSLFNDLELPLWELDENLIFKYKVQAQSQSLNQILKTIFNKQSDDRTYEEIIFINEYLLGFTYFRKIKNFHGQECLFRLSQFAQLISVPNEMIIVKKNEEPNAFYFIIEGQVMQINETQCNVSNIADALFEENLTKLTPNKSEYITKKNSIFIIINAFIFRASLHKYQHQINPKKMIQINHPILNVLQQYDIEELSSDAKIEYYEQGQKIYKINESLEFLYIILEGKLIIGKKVGSIQRKHFQQIPSIFLAESTKEKPQVKPIAEISENDIFGFEEYISRQISREFQVQCLTKQCKVIKFPLKIFFSKFNQVFNLKEFKLLLDIISKRNHYRNRIHSIQVQLYENQSQSTQRSTKPMYYETLEPIPYDHQIRSKPRSFLLENSILLPDDLISNLQLSYKLRTNIKKNDQSINCSSFTLENVTEKQKEKKKLQIRINYQIERELHNNKSFDKTKLIKKQEKIQKQPNDQSHIEKLLNFKSESKYGSVKIKQEVIDQSFQLNQVRLSQNSRYSPLPEIPSFQPKQGKFQQKLILKNFKEKQYLIIDKI